MNPIATAALERARVRRGVRLESSDEEEADGPCMGSQTLARGALAARVRPLPPPHEALKVDLVMRIEGRRQALGMVDRAQGMLQTRTDLENLIAQLRRAAEGRPHSYAVGIQDIAVIVERKLPAALSLGLDDFEDVAPQTARTADRGAPRSAAGRRTWP